MECEDGQIFVVQVAGDSGVGKSEMLAAMVLKWLRKDLPGIRSIRLVAGDMFHVFPDDRGNLYGIGTEQGDFSRVTDFDPDYIKQYATLFEAAADSNVDDPQFPQHDQRVVRPHHALPGGRDPDGQQLRPPRSREQIIDTNALGVFKVSPPQNRPSAFAGAKQ